MERIEFLAGDHISRACEQLVAQANRTLMPVSGNFNGIEIVAKPHVSTAEGLAEAWQAESQKRGEAYRQTETYKLQEANRVRRSAEARMAFAKAIHDAPEIQVNDESEWQALKAGQGPYGAGALRFAENWARIMQKRIASGQTVAQAASGSRWVADPEGITGYMYSCAVNALVHYWIHGEELKAWAIVESAY